MPAIIPFTSQAPQLAAWPLPTLTARNPTVTWAAYVPRLLFNATFLARFRSNWTNAYFSRFNTRYSTGTTALAYAMTYLATGNTTNITAAYNAANGQAYALNPNTDDNFDVDGAAYVLDWCWPALTPAQRTTLIAKLESNTSSRKTAISNSQFEVHEAHHVGFHAYLFGGLAIQGEASTTDRAAELTHAVQNYQWWLAEDSSGFWSDYNYQIGWLHIVQIVWELATGQNIATLSGDPSFVANRWEHVIRNMTPDLQHQYTTGVGDQEKRDAGGYQTYADTAWQIALAGGYTNNAVARWAAVTISGGGANWELPQGAQESGSAAWSLMPYFDLAAAQTPPASALPLCRAYLSQSGTPGGGNMDASWVSFRDGWNLSTGSTDIIAQLYGTHSYTSHPEPGPGHLALQRGMDELLTSGSTYCGSGNNPSGVFCPIQGNWSTNSFHNNCANFAPSGSATPDLDGSAGIAKRTANQMSLFPASGNLIWFTAGGSCIGARVTKFQQSAAETLAAVNCDLAWPVALDPMTYTRTVSFIAASKLLIVRDVYTLANPGRNRFNWWGRSLPVASGSKAVISRGNSQVTIQCLDPAATLTILGGTGNEQVIDGVSYPVNANNCQNGKPVANLAAAVAGQGRATFEVPVASTDVVHALTVDASGTTAPTYTMGQLQALAPMMFGVVTVWTGTAALAGRGALALGTTIFKRAAAAGLAGAGSLAAATRWVSPNPVALGSAGSASTNSLIVQTLFNAAVGDAIIIVAFSPDQTTLMTQAQDSNGTLFGVFAANIAAISPLPQALAAGSTIQLSFAGPPAAHTAIALLVPGTAIALDHLTPTVAGAAAMNLNLGVNT